MFKRINQSPTLVKLIGRLSTLLARRRGLPVVIGIILVLIGFAFQVVNVDAQSPLLELLGIVAHNVGVLVALVGLLLSEPLGK